MQGSISSQDATDEGIQTMTEGMRIDKCELSVERECDVSVLIRQS